MLWSVVKMWITNKYKHWCLEWGFLLTFNIRLSKLYSIWVQPKANIVFSQKRTHPSTIHSLSLSGGLAPSLSEREGTHPSTTQSLSLLCRALTSHSQRVWTPDCSHARREIWAQCLTLCLIKADVYLVLSYFSLKFDSVLTSIYSVHRMHSF